MKGREFKRKENGKPIHISHVPCRRIPINLGPTSSHRGRRCYLLISLELINDLQYRILGDKTVQEQVKSICPLAFESEDHDSLSNKENHVRAIEHSSCKATRSLSCKRVNRPLLVIPTTPFCFDIVNTTPSTLTQTNLV